MSPLLSFPGECSLLGTKAKTQNRYSLAYRSSNIHVRPNVDLKGTRRKTIA